MRQWTVDAFAAEPFKGNPACVVEPFEVWPEAARMQQLAAENNQAETAFLVRTADPARFGLRWFTPALEARLCGHATLASAHVLFAELGFGASLMTFDTLSGPLHVERRADGYRMDFPADPPRRIVPPAGIAEALGVMPVEVFVAAYLIAIVASEDVVRGASPDLAALRLVGSEATDGRGNVAISAITTGAYDVVSRFFAPGSGIPEDPTTGSLHCALTPLFAEKLGRPRLRFHQAYPGRGGDLVCELRGDRVLIDGRAVTVSDGRLRLEL
ncbi:MAG TPA: PhzF family phenazine biosynthesis protein [Caulobacteraceae bacterium]|nr:PhzF family phenazine biosynthesis protein [Caulobacteraceae bacterium]